MRKEANKAEGWKAYIAIAMIVAISACQRPSSTDDRDRTGWIVDQQGISKKESEFLSEVYKDKASRSKLVLKLSDWRGCIAQYGSDDAESTGAAAADKDYDKSRGKFLYEKFDGAVPGERVPGFPDCLAPNRPFGQYGDDPGHFQLLDLHGTGTGDVDIDFNLKSQCRDHALHFAKGYNTELVMLDPHSIAACSGSPSQQRKLSIAATNLALAFRHDDK